MGEETPVLDLIQLLEDSLYPAVVDSHFRVSIRNNPNRLETFASPELFERAEGVFIEAVSGDVLTGIAVDGQAHAPEDFLVPWLDSYGQTFYRLVLRDEEEPTVQLFFQERAATSTLQRIETGGNPRGEGGNLWDLERVKGIPVLHCYTLNSADSSSETQLKAFEQTGNDLRDEPYIILDLRGNGGGNAAYGINWIVNLTGHPAETFQNGISVMLFSETVKATGISEIVGDWYLEEYARKKESGEMPTYSLLDTAGIASPLKSERTIFVLLDSGSGSAAEYFAVFLSMLDNTVLVGAPTMGCFHFGNIVSQSLPNSRISLQCGTNVFLLPDLELHERTGFEPDIWCDPDSALDSVVAFIQQMEKE